LFTIAFLRKCPRDPCTLARRTLAPRRLPRYAALKVSYIPRKAPTMGTLATLLMLNSPSMVLGYCHLSKWLFQWTQVWIIATASSKAKLWLMLPWTSEELVFMVFFHGCRYLPE